MKKEELEKLAILEYPISKALEEIPRSDAKDEVYRHIELARQSFVEGFQKSESLNDERMIKLLGWVLMSDYEKCRDGLQVWFENSKTGKQIVASELLTFFKETEK